VRLRSPEGPRDSGIISLDARDLPGGFPALKAAGVAASLREGGIRLSPHCYNTGEEMERVVDILQTAR